MTSASPSWIARFSSWSKPIRVVIDLMQLFFRLGQYGR
jgi:hypothetical protein